MNEYISLYGWLVTIAPYVLAAIYIIHVKTKHNLPTIFWVASILFIGLLGIVTRKVFWEMLAWISLFFINLLIYRKKNFGKFETGFLSVLNVLIASQIYEFPWTAYNILWNDQMPQLWYWLGNVFTPSLLFSVFFLFFLQNLDKKKWIYLLLATNLFILNVVLWYYWIFMHIGLWPSLSLIPFKAIIRVPTMAAFAVYPMAAKPVQKVL